MLPLTDLSATPDRVLFSDGLTWKITHRLTRMAGLKVIAWNSANQFREATPDLAGLRARLPVSYLLTGIRIDLWPETYDCQIDAVVAVQDEIAHAVRHGLHVATAGHTARQARRLLLP